MHKYPNEPKATSKYMEFLQEELAVQGAPIGQGGFEVLDTHNKKQMLNCCIDGVQHNGYVDGVILPYGSASYAQDMRAGIELKQNSTDKMRYEREHAFSLKRSQQDFSEDMEATEEEAEIQAGADQVEEPVPETVPQKFDFSGRPKGQSTMELLAAYSIAQHPVDVMLTDGHVHHIMRLRGNKILYWANLTAAAAHAHLAHYLNEADRGLDINTAAISKDAAVALEKMRAYRASALAVQADTLMAITEKSEQVVEALALMRAWTPASAADDLYESALPPEIAAFYGR
ncbi:hypothetical protein WJX72_001176 [[Myrmecia] bisecta]|uniref:Uncharacterized protein n=1 Tax=[Myrmecia] bisecta TaxID=41462 RepID=A0AAW1PPR1_9CHLO